MIDVHRMIGALIQNYVFNPYLHRSTIILKSIFYIISNFFEQDLFAIFVQENVHLCKRE